MVRLQIRHDFRARQDFDMELLLDAMELLVGKLATGQSVYLEKSLLAYLVIVVHLHLAGGADVGQRYRLAISIR
jgi:hypothetical protein